MVAGDLPVGRHGSSTLSVEGPRMSLSGTTTGCVRHVSVAPVNDVLTVYGQRKPDRQRTIVEQLNGRLKDEFGGRLIYYRGARKIMTHLMFGIVALTVDQLLRQSP